MKKSITLLLAFFSLYFNGALAQNPGAFKYQTVVRDAAGSLLATQPVSFRFSILDGSGSGPVVYQETASGTTNQFGLCSFEIGRGTAVSGTLAGVNWSSGAKFLVTELDALGGTNYTTMGTAELLAVPYALYAAAGNPGPAGPPGLNGAPGLNCWDLNGNGIADPSEDINGDGNINAADCHGPQGAQGNNGTNGTNGAPGLNCWDLNGNGVADPSEDINGDGNINAADCHGPQGAQGTSGTNGTNGAPGLNCWDLNGNGIADPAEDINGDGNINAADCKGANGANGSAGATGLHCWDLNGNGIADAAEDTNGDGTVNVADCRGANGNNGLQGPQGPAGDASDKSYVAADITSNGSFTNVLSFPIGANEVKSFEFNLMVGQTNSGAVDGMVFQMLAPAFGPSGFLNASIAGTSPVSASGSEIISAPGAPTGVFVKIVTNNGWIKIIGVIKNDGGPATVELQFRSVDSSETATVYKGSYVIARLF